MKIYTKEELSGVMLECYNLLRDNQQAVDDNTEWCIAFWDIKQDETYLDSDSLGIFGAIRKYKPESLTKYRRDLVASKLIFPSKESIEHSAKMEAQNHMPDYMREPDMGWSNIFKRTDNLN